MRPQNGQCPTKMKSTSKALVLLLAWLILFCVGLYTAVTVPPLDRPSYWIDCDNMVAMVVSLPNQGNSRLLLDLRTGKLENKRHRLPVSTNQENQSGWRLYRDDKRDQTRNRFWVMTTQSADGDEIDRHFEFPMVPSVLDENSIIGCSNTELLILDLRTNQRIMHPIPIPNSTNQTVRTKTHHKLRRFMQVIESPIGQTAGLKSCSVSLFAIDENNTAKQLWNAPIYNQQSLQVIGDQLFILNPNQTSVDCYDLASGTLIQTTKLPSDLVTLLKSPGTQSVSLADLQRPVVCFDQAGITKFWSIPDMVQLKLPTQSVVFQLGNDSERFGFARYEDQKVVEIGSFDPESQQIVWTHSVGSDIVVFDQSGSLNRLCYGTSRFGGADFTVLDASTGKVVSQWAPYRWLTWSLPICMIFLVICGWVTIRHVVRWFPTSLAVRLNVIFLLSAVYLTPLLIHVSFWKTHNRPVAAHHYIEGWFVGGLVFCSAWIVWGNGRIVLRLIPPFVIVGLLVALSRLMLNNSQLEMEAVGSTLLAASFSLPLFLGLRSVGIRHVFQSAENAVDRSSWTIPIRDLFILSTGIAVLLAVALPLVVSLSLPSGLPPGVTQMAVSGIAMYGVLTLLIVFHRFRLKSITVAIIFGIAIALALTATFEFATGRKLIYLHNSFEMALWRVAATTLLTFYSSFELFNGRPTTSNQTSME